MNDRNNRNDWIDLHTHTLASGHAYSTIDAMAEAGRKQGLRILDSDAHVDTAVGAHSYAWEVIRENDFPEELVINTQPERLREYLNYYTKGNGAT